MRERTVSPLVAVFVCGMLVAVTWWGERYWAVATINAVLVVMCVALLVHDFVRHEHGRDAKGKLLAGLALIILFGYAWHWLS